MSTAEQKYKDELKANGVDLPEDTEDKDNPELEADAEAKAKAEEEAEAKAKAKSDDKSEDDKSDDDSEDGESKLSDEPEKSRKRSIYDEYKDKKTELKSEREAREKAEKERDELKSKLDAISNADTKSERSDAIDEVEAYAKEIGAEPAAVKKLVELARKGLKPEIPEDLVNDLKEFKEWKKTNSSVIEKQKFDTEFQQTLPTLKELFPNISGDELEEVKKKLDTMSHSKEWHDKPLDFIAFKNKASLSNLISPKKRGMESKSRKDADESDFEFDPEADLSKMTPKQRDAWEEQYRQMTKSEGLATNSQGKKFLI